MATARPFTMSALVMGILSTAQDRRDELMDVLEREFGPVRAVSPETEFRFTDYYNAEMGGSPVRYVILFERLVNPQSLPGIKTRTNELEKLFSNNGGRMVNMDPGLLSLSNFILATCKDRSHRIPLSEGIYAEVTLLYRDHDFQSLPWTYADWASEPMREILRDYRARYKEMLKGFSYCEENTQSV